MHPDRILSHQATVLSHTQRQFYFDNGYLTMPELLNESALAPLCAAMQKILELSRQVTTSNQQFDLEQGHSADHSKLRRVAFVDDLEQNY